MEGTCQNLPLDREFHGARCARDDHCIPLRICHDPSLETEVRNTGEVGYVTVLQGQVVGC